MAEQTLAFHPTTPQKVSFASRQPIVAINMSAPPALQPAAMGGIQPLTIPGSGSYSSANNTASGSGVQHIVSSSPPTSEHLKTGTRSTFSPNERRKSTKLTDEDYDEHDGPVPAFRPQGWLQMLGLKKSPDFGEPIMVGSEPCQQSYY